MNSKYIPLALRYLKPNWFSLKKDPKTSSSFKKDWDLFNPEVFRLLENGFNQILSPNLSYYARIQSYIIC